MFGYRKFLSINFVAGIYVVDRRACALISLLGQEATIDAIASRLYKYASFPS
jgi:hypothetical protein